jgi:predicted HTH transcriptional regulator
MNHNELLKVVLEMPGENRTWEFKRLGTDVSVSKIIETIVAMANTDGGIIILGVDDPEKTKLKGFERIYGIEENPEKYDEIGRSISRITPPIPDLWPPLTLAAPDGKNVAAISIPKARDNFFTIIIEYGFG